MPIGIYPPTLLSSQPAFLYTESTYAIKFSLLKITKFDEIGHILIRLVRLNNNRTIVNTSKYPDGIIYKMPNLVSTIGGYNYSIDILNSDLAQTWEPGTLYKVQMRFGTTAIYSDLASFATWKKEQIDNQTFSEWSTVMIIKPIHKPTIYIDNNEVIPGFNDILSLERIEYVLAPLIFGTTNIEESDHELVDKYKFDLYEGAKSKEEFINNPKYGLIETSDWVLRNVSANIGDKYRFSHILTNNLRYTIFYSIITVNGYEAIADPYTFTVTETYLEKIKNIELIVDSEDVFCKENGCINLYLLSEDNLRLTGCYVITRSSEKSNYLVWEDLKYIVISNLDFNHTLIYQDFTIESGIKYKYAFQLENSEGLRTNPLYPYDESPHYVDFEYSYLFHDGILLKLKFDNRITTFKHTTLTTKQDTLGDKYPHLVRNGYAYYAEFPINGLISFLMDEDLTFLQLKDKGFFYEEDLEIPRDKFEEYPLSRGKCRENGTSLPGDLTNRDSLTIDSNLTNNNIFVERKFREKVEEFLNNFDYKLFKSPTEGNIVIVLHNVTMTPNASLGRMIYEFNATAYEVLENTLENLDKYGVINIGEFLTLESDEIISSFGLVSGIYTTGAGSVDIYELIREQEEISVGGGYKLSLLRLRSFWIERYPTQESILDIEYLSVRERLVGSGELRRLEAALAQAKNNDEPAVAADILEQIDSLLALLKQVLENGTGDTIILSVNGKEILVAPYKLYSLTYPITQLELVASEYPIIINYVAELNLVVDKSVGVVSGIDTTRVWGLIFGVFSDNDTVIKNGYKYNYGKIDQLPYRVTIDPRNYDKNGNVLVDNTNYNLYKTLDIYQIIQEECRRLIELIYLSGTKEKFELNEDGEWVNNNLVYQFNGITKLTIEAKPGTTIILSKNENGKDSFLAKIGDTGRYNIYPADNLVKYIKFAESTFAIIDYSCITSQMRMKVE